eukprot:1285914-Rhodomonas_salina.1
MLTPSLPLPLPFISSPSPPSLQRARSGSRTPHPHRLLRCACRGQVAGGAGGGPADHELVTPLASGTLHSHPPPHTHRDSVSPILPPQTNAQDCARGSETRERQLKMDAYQRVEDANQRVEDANQR